MAAATYATREELNLPVLIFEADDVSGANPVAELDTDEKKIRQMLLGKIERLDSVADKLLAQKKKVILRDVDGDRAKVCVGTKDGDDVLLVLRKSGGTIGKPQTYIPELHCGKMLNILDPGIIFFTEQLSLEFFLRNKRYKKLGIKNQDQLHKAWKRWLVRVWAHMLPTSKVVHHSGRSQEDMAKAKPSGRKRGRSGAPRTNGQADNHPAALTEAEQANKELDDKYGVTRSEEWWSKFNKRSKDFDLDDEEVVRSIRAGWIKAKYPLDQGRMESPSLEVLEEAKAGAQINKVTIENTVDYQNWLWGQSMGARGKVNQTFYPSLFERRAKAKQAEQTKGERGRSGTRRNKPNAGVESEADGSTMGAPPKKKRAFTKEQLDFLKRSKASSD